jgi:pimeloyl-ACP methyl ester carboxylesterase
MNNSTWTQTNFPEIKIFEKRPDTWKYVKQEENDLKKVNLYSRVIKNKKCEFSQNSENLLTVVVLHGLFANGLHFLSFAENLMKENKKVFRVILVDLRNHGLSDHHDSMTFEEMADDIFRHLESLGIQEYILISHSIGAKTAMCMSMKNNNSIKGIVICDTYPIDYKEYPDIYSHTKKMVQMLKDIDLSKYSNKEEVIELIADLMV